MVGNGLSAARAATTLAGPGPAAPGSVATLSEPEAGGSVAAAPLTGDRKFRPDIEGLRAVAVLLVALYHGHIPGIRGGYVGVDVFFVISGFLITGLLLRERTERGTTSIRHFYARRARRILPAATVVVVFTVIASYHLLGFVVGNTVADDAKWTAVFMANLHFAAIGTTYLGSQAPPSPLQHMWSLGVEEQFYVVWPTLFFLIAVVGRRTSLRVRLGIVLSAIIVASFAWSVIETSQSATWAYFSPLTRAWELALGGLVAVAWPLVRRIPPAVASVAGAVGLASVIASGVVLTEGTRYPGSAVAWPVISTAVVIACGSATTTGLAERALKNRVAQWIGARSYSFYLWHWPILIVAYEAKGHNLPVWQNAVWLVVALAASALSYRFVENPIRFARTLVTRASASLVMGAVLIIELLGFAQAMILTH